MIDEEVLIKLLTLVKKNENLNLIDESIFGVTKEEFGKVVEYAKKFGYLKNVSVVRNGQGNKIWSIVIDKAIITDKGMRFLNM